MTSTEVISKIIEAGVNDDLKEAERVLMEYCTLFGRFSVSSFADYINGRENISLKIGSIDNTMYKQFLNHQKEQL